MAKERSWQDYLDAGEEIPSTEIAPPLNSRQRQEILKRDEEGDTVTQLRSYSESRGFFRRTTEDCIRDGCRPDKCTPHVHHVQPRGVGGQDVPENLLKVAPCQHTGVKANGQLASEDEFVIHRDTRDATERYRRGDRNSFHNMAENRRRKKEAHEKYWDDSHDSEMEESARQNTEERHGWRWPWQRR